VKGLPPLEQEEKASASNRAQRQGGHLAFGDQVAIFSKKNRPLKPKSRRQEHGRVKHFRLGYKAIRVGLATWFTQHRQDWEGVRADKDSLIAKYFKATEDHLKRLRWTLRSDQERTRSMMGNPDCRPKHGGKFAQVVRVDVTPLLDEYSGLAKILCQDTAAVAVYPELAPRDDANVADEELAAAPSL
jgi:hypothetical protein